MAITCPVDFDSQKLRREVREFYARVADHPDDDFHFHNGPDYAAEFLGYDRAELAQLPTETTASFAGVGNPLSIDEVSPGAVVVDVGCGAGTDLLLAARRVGPKGRAIGVDMTPRMRDRASASARALGLDDVVDVRAGDAESLPVDDGSADVVMSNGVINLTTDKRRAFAEIHRVLAPGGRLLLADIVVRSELSESVRGNVDLWTA